MFGIFKTNTKPEPDSRTSAVHFMMKNQGSRCEVLDADNRFLFSGVAGNMESRNGRIAARIDLGRGKGCPQGFGGEMPVKLKFFAKKGQGQMLLYGKAIQYTTDFWYVVPESLSTYTEKRKYFRQPVSSFAFVRSLTSESLDHPCQLLDISLTGACFASNGRYLHGERLLLSGLQLLPGGQEYKLKCQEIRQSYLYRGGFSVKYGCRFLEMSSRDRENLCRDILTLQSQSLRQ